MGIRKIPIDDVEQAVVSALKTHAQDQGLSLRSLADATGLGKSRLGDLFNGLTSCTMTDLERLCSALGLRPSSVLSEAEGVVAARVREEERERLLAGLAAGVPVESLGLAAKRDLSWAREAAERSGWREDLGEEPQAGPAEEG
ncbi:helix-turn-helix domain-containing protein [Actinomyces bovis]|uniref:helix-turn-helix domain-containing protein n=1 Tax=Actinomyces bovis TaxID=1658 RepID=UPI001475C100|nr:helix-turn-helix transcriptional regulator [Actinomyces bovis]